MKTEWNAVIPVYLKTRLDGVGGTARAIAMALGFRMGVNGYCEPAQAELAEEIGKSRRSVLRALGELREAGVIVMRVHGRQCRYSWASGVDSVQQSLFPSPRRITPADREKYADAPAARTREMPSDPVSPGASTPVENLEESPIQNAFVTGKCVTPVSHIAETTCDTHVAHQAQPVTPMSQVHYKENNNMNFKETSSSLNNPETFTGGRRTTAMGGGGYQKVWEIYELARRLIASFPVSLAEAKLDNPESLIAFARNLPGDRKYPMRYRLADTVAAANCVWRKNRKEIPTTATPQDRMFGILTKKPTLIKDEDVDPVTRIIHAVNTLGLHPPPVRAVAAPEAGTRESLLDRVAGVLVCACGRREENPTRWDADATYGTFVHGAPVCPDCNRPGIHGNRAFHPENPEQHEIPTAAVGGA